MLLLVTTSKELDVIFDALAQVANKPFRHLGNTMDYQLVTMMEISHTYVYFRMIATTEKYMSLGTNDLTQRTFGFSLNYIRKFVSSYLGHKILSVDPFVSLN